MAESLEERVLNFLRKQKDGAMPEYIAQQLGVYTSDVYPVLRKLQKDGTLTARDLFAYDPVAAREAEKDEEEQKKKQ
jgi:DNA-binding IclR family transcriptional regulator